MGQLENMTAFVRIVEAGSISRASEQLGTVKSAVSRRLVELEQELGVQLIQRTTRTSSLTEAGRNYYQRAVQILADVSELNNSSSNKTLELEGQLRIAVPTSFGLLHLAPAINEFAELHPKLIIHLDFSDRKVDLVEEGFDLAIRIAALKDSSLIARRLAPVKIVMCASPDYLKRFGAPKTPGDLKHHRCPALCAASRLEMEIRFTARKVRFSCHKYQDERQQWRLFTQCSNRRAWYCPIPHLHHLARSAKWFAQTDHEQL